ncbi:O-antigen ligase family protein [Dermatophilus congolensis]|uniref:O-antigen ligase family protein n=1 Tax=Dermatophilus congolensis TaxID=1863 RepID=UPI001AAF5771|nr:O-antigen ligase family protein [Dermatophilus congolensis]MBO3128729.1 O-antigen ligase family protein [Dermatophilus congolensis]MBO3132634.1 O-antigen ligase family protein [Dermatophilus congolensis]MBO3133205.1 O-antigen ligase family protein [Dermatophilus congolensis]MBO3135440.1 O-antigen ligase family protein [Dermatophilus congolensis]MBO3137680.1 O-antigen ligase family protein [Dermatophilus congolensis]
MAIAAVQADESGHAYATRAQARSLRWRSIPIGVWLLFAGLAANVFSGHADDMGLPIGLDRVLLPAAFVAALMDRRARWWRLRSAHIAMLAFAAAATGSYLSMPWTVSLQSFFTLLDRVYIPFLLFAFAPYFLGTAARRALFLRMLTLLGVYLTVTTIAEALGANFLLFPRYIAAHREQLASMAAMSEDATRAGGPFLFGEPNGMTLAICAFAATVAAWRERGRWRVVALVTAPCAVAALIATMTRSVWLGTVLAVVCVAVTRWRWFLWLPVAAVAGVGSLLVGAWLFPQLAADASQRAGMSSSLWDRVTTNDAAMQIIAAEPLTGAGWQQFIQVVPDWARQADVVPLANTHIEVHNVVLSRGAELGVPGLVLFVLALLLGPVAALFRRVRVDLVPWQLFSLSVFVVWFTVSMTSPNPYPLPTFLMWFVAGFALALPQEPVSAKTVVA